MARTGIRIAGLVVLALAGGCETTNKVDVLPYEVPTTGPVADFTVQTGRMWLTNRITMVLLRAGEGKGEPRAVRRIGQLQSGEYVRREVLTLDAKLPAGVPLWLHFEYRYDAGALTETGCDFPLTVTLAPGASYLLDFIRDTTSCRPRLYQRMAGGTLQELPISPN